MNEIEIIKTLSNLPINVALLYIVWRHGGKLLDMCALQFVEINKRLDNIADELKNHPR